MQAVQGKRRRRGRDGRLQIGRIRFSASQETKVRLALAAHVVSQLLQPLLTIEEREQRSGSTKDGRLSVGIQASQKWTTSDAEVLFTSNFLFNKRGSRRIFASPYVEKFTINYTSFQTPTMVSLVLQAVSKLLPPLHLRPPPSVSFNQPSCCSRHLSTS